MLCCGTKLVSESVQSSQPEDEKQQHLYQYVAVLQNYHRCVEMMLGSEFVYGLQVDDKKVLS